MAPQQKEKPKYVVEQADAETTAKLTKETNPDAYEQDAKMLKALGIDLPPEKVIVTRGVNHPLYAFFKTDDETLIMTATPYQVFEAADKAKGTK